jgi:hypothetical protein
LKLYKINELLDIALLTREELETYLNNTNNNSNNNTINNINNNHCLIKRFYIRIEQLRQQIPNEIVNQISTIEKENFIAMKDFFPK